VQVILEYFYLRTEDTPSPTGNSINSRKTIYHIDARVLHPDQILVRITQYTPYTAKTIIVKKKNKSPWRTGIFLTIDYCLSIILFC
jgi:hypothetical protein